LPELELKHPVKDRFHHLYPCNHRANPRAKELWPVPFPECQPATALSGQALRVLPVSCPHFTDS
jgi:hypothetical protein